MANVPKYRAVRTCYHRNFHYQPGDLYAPSIEEMDENHPAQIPEHFVKERDFSADLVEEAEREDRTRTVFVKPMKADEVHSPAASKKEKESK